MDLQKILDAFLRKKEELRDFLEDNCTNVYYLDNYTVYHLENITVLYDDINDCLEEVSGGYRE